MNQQLITFIASYIDNKYPSSNKGRPKKCRTEHIVERIIFVLKTGIQWRCLSSDFLSPKTIHNYFRKWSSDGVFSKAYFEMLKKLRTSPKYLPEYYCTDTTLLKSIFGIDVVGPNPTDRGRNASKISVIIDSYGILTSATFHEGNRNDCVLLPQTLKSVPKNTFKNGKKLYGDKGYDSRFCRKQVKKAKLIPRLMKRFQTYSKKVHRKRNLVERFFSWMKLHRRLLLRFERYIAQMESFFWLFCLLNLSRKQT